MLLCAQRFLRVGLLGVLFFWCSQALGHSTSQFVSLSIDEVGDEVAGFIPGDGGKLLITNTARPVLLQSLQVVSQTGTLLVGDDPSPFAWFDEVSPKSVVLRISPATPVLLQGSIELDLTITDSNDHVGIAWEGISGQKFGIVRILTVPEPGATGTWPVLLLLAAWSRRSWFAERRSSRR